MDWPRFLLVLLGPPALVAARFVFLGPATDPWSDTFAIFGFTATLIGCAPVAWLFRARLRLVPYPRLGLAVVLIAVIPLMFVFPFMPNWPLTDFGFIVAWVAITAVLSWLCLLVAHVYTPNLSSSGREEA